MRLLETRPVAYLRLRGDRLRLRRPDPEELRAHAVHVAHQIVAGDVGERGRELDDDVGVRDAHEVVERRHPVLFDRPGHSDVVEARVLQVVRVADADDVGEGVRPPRAVVVPGIARRAGVRGLVVVRAGARR